MNTRPAHMRRSPRTVVRPVGQVPQSRHEQADLQGGQDDRSDLLPAREDPPTASWPRCLLFSAPATDRGVPLRYSDRPARSRLGGAQPDGLADTDRLV